MPSTASRRADDPSGDVTVRVEDRLESAPPSKARTARVPRPDLEEPERREVDGPVDRLVPFHIELAADLEAADAGEVRPSTSPPVQRASTTSGAGPAGTGCECRAREPVPPRRGTRSGPTNRSEPSSSLNLAGHEHAELPAHLVLPRRRPVGVEHVALVEDGIGDRLRRREAVASPDAHSPSSPACFSSCSKRLVPRRKGPSGLVSLQKVEGVAADAGASRCWGSTCP